MARRNTALLDRLTSSRPHSVQAVLSEPEKDAPSLLQAFIGFRLNDGTTTAPECAVATAQSRWQLLAPSVFTLRPDSFHPRYVSLASAHAAVPGPSHGTECTIRRSSANGPARQTSSGTAASALTSWDRQAASVVKAVLAPALQHNQMSCQQFSDIARRVTHDCAATWLQDRRATAQITGDQVEYLQGQCRKFILLCQRQQYRMRYPVEERRTSTESKRGQDMAWTSSHS